jgi:hypothetical protein
VVMRGTPCETLGQTRTGNQIATITAIAPSISPNLPVTKRRNVIGSGMNMGLNIKEWW